MRKLVALLLLFASSVCAEEWKPIDRQLFVAAHVLSTIDWLQSRDIVRSEIHHEKGLLLSRDPSLGEVNTHYLFRSAALTAAAFAFPRYRTAILGNYVAVTLIVVGRNAHLGLRIAY